MEINGHVCFIIVMLVAFILLAFIAGTIVLVRLAEILYNIHQELSTLVRIKQCEHKEFYDEKS